MKKLIFILPFLLIVLSCESQSWFPYGFWVGDTSISGSEIALIDSIIVGSDDTLRVYSGGTEFTIGRGGGGGGGTYNSGSGITIDGSNNIDLGGALDAAATITGTAANNISFDMVDAGSHSARLDFQTGTGLSISGWNADNFTGDYGYLSVDNGGILFAQYDGAAEKSISLTSTSFVIRDDDGSQGPTFYADYRSNLTDLGIANWLTIKDTSFAQLGGQDLDATITSPGAGQDGGLVGWNNSTSKWEVKDVVPLDETDNVMLVADSTISFQNTSSSVIVNLPIGTVVWDIQVYVETAFTGTGTDLLDVGITGTGEKFTADLDLSVADGLIFMFITQNTPHK
jgi:hypothetical protein